MKLFAIVVGGEHPRANVEIHDVRFVVADRIEDTYDALKAQWWGAPGTLHIDCWAQIDHVDGFDGIIDTEPQARVEQLCFVNLGGYDLRQFAELHRNVSSSLPPLKRPRLWRPPKAKVGVISIATTSMRSNRSSH